MSDDKKTSASTTARKIWLAGIGAYGRAFSEAQDMLKDVTGKSNEIFDDLVQKGEGIEKAVEIKGKQVMKKTGAGFDIDERIQSMRSRLSGGSAENVEIEARLDAIEAKLDMILKELKPKKRASTKRATTKKTAAKS